MTTIQIYRGANCWIARFPKDSEEAKVMGTVDIPLPFTPKASATMVENELSKNYNVVCGLAKGWDVIEG